MSMGKMRERNWGVSLEQKISNGGGGGIRVSNSSGLARGRGESRSSEVVIKKKRVHS